MPFNPQLPIYRVGSDAQFKVFVAGIIAAILAFGSIAWSIYSALIPEVRSQLISGGLAAMWAVGAPLWFWYEYYYIYRGTDGGEPDSFEHFKQGQQTAVAIWAGLSAALGAFAASDFSKAPPQKYECKMEISTGLEKNPSPVTAPLRDATFICTKETS